MPVIHLIGPNAVGKTTAVQRWARRYGGMTVASLDLLRKEAPDKDGKQRYIREHSSATVLVAESVYTNQIVVASCDRGVTFRGDERLSGYNWKGSLEKKAAALDALRAAAPVGLTQSARTTTAAGAAPGEPVIIVVCPAEKLKAHMLERCAAKGKKFRAEYWTDDKLGYESSRRYLNFAAKYLREGQYKVFWIRDQAQDWPVVDEYFGSLYRRLHNEIVRGRS